MLEVVQVKAVIPRALKRQAFSALALREEKFSRWLCQQLEQWLQEQQSASPTRAPVARGDGHGNESV